MKKMKIQGRTALVLAALIGVSSLGMAFTGILGGQGLQARMAQGRQVWPTRADQVIALEGEEPGSQKEDAAKNEEKPASKVDPAKKQEDPANKQEKPAGNEDPAKKQEDPAKKQEKPAGNEDPAKKQEDPANKQEKPGGEEDPANKEQNPGNKEEDPASKKNPAEKQEDPQQNENAGSNQDPTEDKTNKKTNGPEVIKGYRVIPGGMTYQETMKAYKTVVLESQLLIKNNAMWDEEPDLSNPSNMKPGKLSSAAIHVVSNFLNLYRCPSNYQHIQWAGSPEAYQAYAALCHNARAISHTASDIINAEANQAVPATLKQTAAQVEGQHHCLALGFDFLNDVSAWFGEGFENGKPVSEMDLIGHRTVHVNPIANTYLYGHSGNGAVAGLYSKEPYDPSSYTPRITPPVGQLPKYLVSDGMSLLIDFRYTTGSAGDDFEVEVYVPDKNGMYDISSPSKAVATYKVSSKTIALGENGSFASVMPPWLDENVLAALGIRSAKEAGEKPIVYGLILRNVHQADGTNVDMATANLLPESDESGAVQKPEKVMSENLNDPAYNLDQDDPSFKKVVQALLDMNKYSEASGNENTVLLQLPVWAGGDRQASIYTAGSRPGENGRGNSGNHDRGNSGGNSGNAGNGAGQTSYTPDGEADEGWFRQIKTLKASPKWFWTINAGRMQAFLHKQGLDEKSFEKKYHTTVQKVLDQYADDLVSAEDLEDLLKRQFFGPYEGEDYMLSLSRALQASGYSYYAQFNLMDWSADYSNLYGLTPEADPMAEWRVNPVQYILQTDPDGSSAGESGEGGDASGESERSNRRTRQTGASEVTTATVATEPAAGEESQEEPTAPSAVESQEGQTANDAQSGPTTIPAESAPQRRRRGTATQPTQEKNPEESAEATTTTQAN